MATTTDAVWRGLLVVLVIAAMLWSVMVNSAYTDRDHSRYICQTVGKTWDDNGLKPWKFWREGHCT